MASPEGAQENSPGREPGVRVAAGKSPEGAKQFFIWYVIIFFDIG